MPEIIVQSDGSVLRLRLNRPERLNALTHGMIDQLLDALEQAATDDGCRVVVISGEGRAFCAGDDLKGMGAVPGRRWQGRKLTDAPLPQQRLIQALRTLPKPVVASIHGYALGMGLDMALACDIRVCTETTVLGDPRAERALYAATGITYQLPRIVGYGRALAMMLLAEKISGREAERIGLVYKAVPDQEITAAVEDVVGALAKAATKSIAVIKQQMVEQLDLPYELAAQNSIFIRTTTTIEDLAEGRRAFIEKRAPQFSGH